MKRCWLRFTILLFGTNCKQPLKTNQVADVQIGETVGSRSLGEEGKMGQQLRNPSTGPRHSPFENLQTAHIDASRQPTNQLLGQWRESCRRSGRFSSLPSDCFLRGLCNQATTSIEFFDDGTVSMLFNQQGCIIPPSTMGRYSILANGTRLRLEAGMFGGIFRIHAENNQMILSGDRLGDHELVFQRVLDTP